MIRAADRTTRAPADRRGVTVLGIVVALAAAAATGLGADRARRTPDARMLANEALRVAAERGNEAVVVRDTLRALRRTVGERPLDSRTRVIYAELVLGVSRSVNDVGAAVFHARRAAELAPVTLPVVRRAALVLAHTREVDDALAIVRDVLGFDPDAGADLLAHIGPLLGEDAEERALPPSPDAWMARALRLERDGERQRALERLRAAHRRWPDHLPLLEHLALKAVQRGDWNELETLFADAPVLPERRDSAGVLVQRARLHAYRGDLAAARRDVEHALALDPASHGVRLQAGLAWAAIGEAGQARRCWTRVLYELPGHESARRVELLRELARLEEREGQAAAALRRWRDLLEIDTDDREARAGIGRLTGRAPA